MPVRRSNPLPATTQGAYFNKFLAQGLVHRWYSFILCSKLARKATRASLRMPLWPFVLIGRLRQVVTEGSPEAIICALCAAAGICSASIPRPQVTLEAAVLETVSEHAFRPVIDVVPIPCGKLLNIFGIASAVRWRCIAESSTGEWLGVTSRHVR